MLEIAGISAGGAYNYFSSKADIVKELVEEERAGISMLLAQMKANDDPVQGIAQLIHDAIKHTRHEDAVLSTEIYAEACRNPDIATITQASLRDLEKQIHQTISRAAKSGQVTHAIHQSI